jgi:hypothetical protein
MLFLLDRIGVLAATALLFAPFSSAAHDNVLLRGSSKTTTGSDGQPRDLQAAAGAVTSLQLILATNIPDRNLGPLVNDQIVYLGDLPVGSRFNIDALVSGPTVKSVRFGWNARPTYRIESGAPFAFCGNVGPDFVPCPNPDLTVGNHTVTATPFTLTGATGTAGTPLTVRFTIVPGKSPGSAHRSPHQSSRQSLRLSPRRSLRRLLRLSPRRSLRRLLRQWSHQSSYLSQYRSPHQSPHRSLHRCQHPLS